MTIHAFRINEDGDTRYAQYPSLDALLHDYEGDIERVRKEFGAATFDRGQTGGVLIEGVLVKPWPKRTVTELELVPAGDR